MVSDNDDRVLVMFLMRDAVLEYETITGHKLSGHGLVHTEFVGDVIAFTEERLENFKDYRHDGGVRGKNSNLSRTRTSANWNYSLSSWYRKRQYLASRISNLHGSYVCCQCCHPRSWWIRKSC